MKNMKTISLRVAVQIFLCIAIAAFYAYGYMNRQNEMMELRLLIPATLKNLKAVEEENARLAFAIESFNHPQHLMELLKEPEYSHLKFVNSQQVIRQKDPP